ncbi:hypothetical protein [Pseudomonas putida]|uniref:hypothetical protein n=1 Tax=Pseudomonas putida TaxID=303 RepID=UPI0039069B54
MDAVDLILKTKAFFQDRSPLQLSINEVMEKAPEIKDFSSYLHNEYDADFKFYTDTNPELGETACLMSLWFELSGRFYIAIIAWSGELGRAADSRYQLRGKRIEMIYKTVIYDPQQDRDAILQQIGAAVARFTTPLPIVNLLPAMLGLDEPAHPA